MVGKIERRSPDPALRIGDASKQGDFTFIFGSVARGHDHVTSDVDIAIDAAPFVGSPAVMEIEEILAERLGRPVQIVSKRGLRSQ